MRVIRGLDNAASTIDACAVTVGAFDGVHLGHRHLFGVVSSEAQARGVRSVIMTFDRHPAHVFGSPESLELLSPPDEHIELLRSVPVDHIVVAEFTPELYGLSARDFASSVLVERLGTRCFVMGESHRFGRGGEGDYATAQILGEEFGFSARRVTAHQVDGEPVSSTRVRKAVADGDMRMATKLLGRRHSLAGIVQPGDGRGRTLGFPTANFKPHPHKLLPPTGVYACRAQVDGECSLGASVYVGSSPTFEGVREIRVECHLLETPDAKVPGDLYGKQLRIFLIERLRGDITFAGPDELVRQIEGDVARTREILDGEGA